MRILQPRSRGLVAAERGGVGCLTACPGESAAGLDGDQFLGGVRHGVGDGPVDLFRAGVQPDQGTLGGRGSLAGDPHEGAERLGQLCLAPPFGRDALPGAAQQPVQCDDRGHGLQTGRVVEGRVQQAEVDEARGRVGFPGR
ncbi:hypothetical protein GCM10010234_48420 [Streptomyces hawaiiensis]